MSLPRFRIRLRHSMAILAILALGLGLWIMKQRSDEFRLLAAEQAEAEQLSMAYADDARGPGGDPQRVARGEQMAAYHRDLRLKYESAARHPWSAVGPDPPIPEPPE